MAIVQSVFGGQWLHLLAYLSGSQYSPCALLRLSATLIAVVAIYRVAVHPRGVALRSQLLANSARNLTGSLLPLAEQSELRLIVSDCCVEALERKYVFSCSGRVATGTG